jgi:hypothetical protein
VAEASTAPASKDKSAAGASTVGSSAPGASGAPSVAALAPLEVADASRVDAQELAARAKALALGVQKQAKLVRIVTSDLNDDGTVDLGAGGFVEYRFEYRDSSDPAAAQTGQIVVSVQKAGIGTALMPGAVAADTGAVEALADPSCPLKTAWRQATAAGPPGAKAHAEYARHPRTKGSVWMILAAGSPPFERSVDGLTCALHDGFPKKKRVDEDPY